ncbi:MAG: DUF4147 domain-containing protein [Balneolales bacterium]|nr:DUF4147 domain-containing protein [Balneolales bacterium]
MHHPLKETALQIFNITLAAMDPESRLSSFITLQNGSLFAGDEKVFEDADNLPIYIAGAGKAAARMAKGLCSAEGLHIKDGVIIAPESEKNVCDGLPVQVFPGTHPLPGQQSLASTFELLDFVASVPKDALTIILISGGASALMEIPEKGISIEELSSFYDSLLRSGAGIHEMNVVRKQLSAVKGGKLLGKTGSDKVLSVIISDVPGDDPAIIASGPTTPHNSKKADAVKVLRKYKLYDDAPHSIKDFLNSPDLPKLDHQKVHKTVFAGSSLQFAEYASDLCRQAGFETELMETQYAEDAESVAEMMLGTIKPRSRKKGKFAYIFHGESTVEVKGDGKGGRNQHLALLVTPKISGKRNILMLSAGTDGVDGNTDVAGAITSNLSRNKAVSLNLDPEEFAGRFDSWHFFKNLGDLIFTGPTGNNVMDFQLFLIDA